MADLTSFITIAPSNNTIFTNAINNDMLIYTESHTQNILLGTQSNIPAVLKLSSNSINVGASVLPITDVTYDLGSSNKRFRDLYLSGNTIDLGGTLIKKDTVNNALSVTDSSGQYQGVIVSQIQVGNSSNVVTIQLDSNNQVQFVATTLSNGQSTGSNVASVGGWSNIGSNLVILGSNVGIGTSAPTESFETTSNAKVGCNLYVLSNLGVGKSNPSYSVDTAGDINFDGILYKNGVPYIGSQWSNDSVNVFILESNVGIGTMSPFELLEVAGNAKIESNAYIMSNTGIRTAFPTEALEVYNGNALIGCNMYVMSNLGVGTSNPGYPLEVIGNAMIRSNLTVEGTLTAIKMNVVTSNILVYSNQIVNDTLVVLNRVALSNTSGYSYFDSLGSNVGLNTGAPTESLTIVGCNIGISNASGKTVLTGSNNYLGINVADPQFTLDVGGDLNFSGMLRQGGVPYIGSQWSNNSSNVFMLGSNIGLGTSNPMEALDIQGLNAKVGCNMYVLSNLGIGKSNPAYSLDTTGDINFGGILRQNGVPYIGSQWSNNSSNVFIFGSNIGIGISNPTAALSIAGDLDVRSNILLTNQQLVFRGVKVLKNSNMAQSVTNVTSAITSIPGYSYGSSNHLFTTTSNNYFSVTNGSSETMRVMSNMVGIGTQVPTSILHLASNAAANVLITMCNTATGSMPSVIGLSNSGDMLLSSVSNLNMLFFTSNSERLRITSNGNIGINKANPQFEMDVNGTIAVSSNLRVGSNFTTGNSSYIFVNDSLSSAFGVRADNIVYISAVAPYIRTSGDNTAIPGTGSNARPLQIYGSNITYDARFGPHWFVSTNVQLGGNSLVASNLLTVAGAASIGASYSNVLAPANGLIVQGNVGIGTTNPVSRLDVAGQLTLGNDGGWTTGGVRFKSTNGTADAAIVQGNNGKLLFRPPALDGAAGFGFVNGAANADIFTITNTGNVGIGTTGPTYKLHVVGNTFLNGANKIVVQNSVDGGNAQGIYMWNSTDTNWGIYMSTSGAGKSLSGGTAAGGWNFTSHAMRFRVTNGSTTGFVFENSSEGLVASFRGDGGGTYLTGPLNTAVNVWHVSSDAKNRIYWANNSHTYFGSPDTWRFQHSTNGDVATINSAGYATFNSGVTAASLQVAGGSGFRVSATGHLTIGDSYNGNNPGISIINSGGNSSGYYATGFNIYSGAYNATRLMFDSLDGYVRIMASNNYPPWLGGNSYLQIQINPSGGNVYIGSGGLTVNGSVSKTGGSFDIPHPDPEKSNEWRLRHCFVETPTRGDNIYTYKVTTTSPNESFTIDLPGYFKHLNENPRTMVSCEEEDVLSRCCARVNSDLTQVKGMCEFPATYVVMVIGTRKDQAMIDYFDNTGGVEYQLKESDPRHPNFTPPSAP